MAETLCWRCKRPGTRTCSWDDSMGTVPVEGWDAEETRRWGWNESCVTSYRVKACPLFEEEENYDYRMTHSVGLGPARRVRAERAGRPIADRERIEHLFLVGWRNEAIAREFGLAVTTITRYKSEWYKKRREAGL